MRKTMKILMKINNLFVKELNGGTPSLTYHQEFAMDIGNVSVSDVQKLHSNFAVVEVFATY